MAIGREFAGHGTVEPSQQRVSALAVVNSLMAHRGEDNTMTQPRETDPTELALNDPELMRIWGALNAEWDEIEHWLYIAFDSMLSDDEYTTRAIFYSQRSHAARRDMVEALAKYYFRDDARSYLPLKNVIKRVKARSNARHELAHGSWSAYLEPGKPLQISRVPEKPQMIDSLNSSYSKAALQRVAADMRDTAIALKAAASLLQEKKLARTTVPTDGHWVPVPKPLS